MQIVWTPDASLEREKAIEYIAQESIKVALSQLDEIEQQTDRLAEYPKFGRPGRVRG